MLLFSLLVYFPAATSAFPLLPQFSQLFSGHLVIFGDSFTDDGIDVSGNRSDQHGFLKYSNGPVWTDYLGQKLNLVDGCMRERRPENWAYSGAKSDLGNYYFKGWSGVLWQVEQFLNSDLKYPDTSLIVMQSGGANDVANGDLTNEQLEEVAQNAIAAVQKLADANFRKIVMLSNADITRLPAYEKEALLSVKSKVAQDVAAINALMAQKVAQFQASNPDVQLISVNFDDLWDTIVRTFSHPNEIFTHHRSDPIPGEMFEYGFYDDWHVSTGSHMLIAQLLESAIGDAFGKSLSPPSIQYKGFLKRLVSDCN